METELAFVVETAPKFVVWSFQKKQFIAVPRGTNWHVADVDGNNYGAWQSVDNFRERQKRADAMASPIGTCELAIRSLS